MTVGKSFHFLHGSRFVEGFSRGHGFSRQVATFAYHWSGDNSSLGNPAALWRLCAKRSSQVSYYGDSYCRIEAIQDVSTFELSLQFKTSRRSGLLLLAAGMEDYMFLELQNGKLQVRMNMGAGEVTLSSSLGVQLNNLLEHHVSVILQDSKLTMTIDKLFPTYVPVPGADEEELNIDIGVWLGGTGDLDAPFLSNAIPPFRGCMADVKFESHRFDILNSEMKDCHDTKESCSSEFEAGDGEATSFISPDSFISLPTWSGLSGEGRGLEFLMKTTIEDAVLVFHPGRESDFIAVGVVGGFLKGVVDIGKGMQVLDNTQVKLDDDQWHRVRLQVEKTLFEIDVDSQASSLPLDDSESLDLVGNLYLGGIQRKMKDVFHDSGILDRMEEQITSESFIGCFGDIKVNQKDRSLQDALVTKDVHVKCEGEDYDYYDSEATTTAAPVLITYSDSVPNKHHCYPTEGMPEAFRNITTLLEVTPLLVPEGGEAFLDINNLSPTFDLNAVGMRQSQIIFTLKNNPWYGLLDMNLNTKHTKKFTLLDVVNKKIKYLHDGNEKYDDQIQLEVAANSNGYLPECLKMSHEYTLPVEVIPVNDIPQLGGGDIQVTENGRTRLSSNLIKIVDSDTRCDELRITLTSAPSRNIYLENDQRPGRPITEFTCRQLKDGLIFFVHKGGSVEDITLEVADGHSVSQSTTFKMSVTKPHMTIVTNSGIVLSQGSNATIGVQQLAVIAHPHDADVVYNVTQPLRYGELILITSNGMPKQITSFYQSDLDQGSVLYVSTDSSDQENNVIEHIQFDIHLGLVSKWNNTLLVKILPAPVKISHLNPVEVEAEMELLISQENLQATVNGHMVNPQTVKYVLLKPPTLGSLRLQGSELSEGDTFTEQDIHNHDLSYMQSVHSAVESVDQFQFRVFVGDEHSPIYTMPITIISDPSADSTGPLLTIESLAVLQGGEDILSKKHLWVQSPSSVDFVYRVTQDPKHGRLIRESPPGQPRFDGGIRVFSNEDLQLDRLIYKHDGSKTDSDDFHFTASDETSVQTNAQSSVIGVFRITIQSKNEHVPVRVVDKSFNVVRNGQRLLTTDVLQFRDDDANFNDTQIIYAHEGILSGQLVSVSNPSQPLFRFTQADLRDKRILFVHHGADRDNFQLQVSDGLHQTTTLMQLHAGEPYLRVENNTMVVMDHGSTKTIDTTLLSADSNMDVRDDGEIAFEVTSPPGDGRIIVSGIEALRFTQEDLKKGVVSYEHNYESLRSKDSFGFTVRSKGYSQEGTFRIKIFKQGYYSEPEVVTNKVLIAYEGEHTVVDQDHLKVEQSDILPSEMVFTIREPARLGHVVMLVNNSDRADAPVLDFIHSFTQDDVDEGRVLYVSASQQGSDVFRIDVTNGFTTVENLEVAVRIVPRLIPLHGHNFTVKEGLGVSITTEILNISHSFYDDANIDFVVEEAPRHGDLRYQDGTLQELTYFTWEEVKLGHVFYMHDSSETTEDSFTLSASAYEIERHSLSVTVGITVKPVNDEPPTLTRNTGLEVTFRQVLAGEETDITSSMLSTEDADTPLEELVYRLDAPPAGGVVALKEAPDQSIMNFTQAQINNGEVIFIHEGEEMGGFSFKVTDGEHTSPLYRFTVTARPLTITMGQQEDLMVFPGTRQPITSANLGAVTNEDGNEISYAVLRPPRLGRLILASDRNQYEEITGFTQTQLESGLVFYEHQLPDEPFWAVRDAVELLLSSDPAPDLRHVLPVTVSYYASHPNASSQLWRNEGLDVVQGEAKVIDRSVLDASNLLASVPASERGRLDVVYEVTRFPARGRLTLAGADVPRGSPVFTQADVTRGSLEYVHTDDSGAASSSSSDSFAFRAYLNLPRDGVTSSARSVVLEEALDISVVGGGGGRREDTSPPELVDADTAFLDVLQDSLTVLTRAHLNARDEDSPPGEVRYEVTRAPGNGRLVDSVSMEPVSGFTQAMVDQGRVSFASDGDGPADGAVEFTVSDGEHRVGPHALRVAVRPRTLVLAAAPEIRVRQGDDETPLTEDVLRATSEGEVVYNITDAPKYAAVMVDRRPTSGFTQTQIRQGRVSVRFLKATSPRDSVALVAFAGPRRRLNVSSVLNITVEPLAVIARDPVLPRGTLVRLDRALLDASPLENKTMASAVFVVLRRPRGARFVRSGGPGGGGGGAGQAGQPVDTFTQQDLDKGRIAMEISDDPDDDGDDGDDGDDDGVSRDEARFLLKAHGVPPAECALSFRTAPYNASGLYPVTLLRTPGKDNQPVVSRRSNLWSILIPILIILLLLLLAAILAYYLIRKNKTGKHNVQMVAAAKPKNGEVASSETFRKTDAAGNIPMADMDGKDADPELLQHCRTTNPALKKNQYWV
ncbi:Chondroitin sulfate proteoglycan 4 [Merluccius polli]|uniref:Chondroitin sulfate proteoglycan 4 n=1 Tax=Merluccius polli TaxID=89951 RepID=A0AA47M9A9_MERPO|nr:Chondroitin sulfate proteoglycan 4 [Merluccius polli]